MSDKNLKQISKEILTVQTLPKSQRINSKIQLAQKSDSINDLNSSLGLIDTIIDDKPRGSSGNEELKMSNSDTLSIASIQEPKTQQRRQSFDKKDRNATKVDEEYTQTRYVLFYADEIVQLGILTKSQVQYQQMLGFDETGKLSPSLKLDEQFKQSLRQEQGIFFDIDVRPSSPRKRDRLSGQVISPFIDCIESDPPNNTTFGPQNESYEFRSPTFKNSFSDKASSIFVPNQVSKQVSKNQLDKIIEQNQSDSNHMRDYESRLDKMLMSNPCSQSLDADSFDWDEGQRNEKQDSVGNLLKPGTMNSANLDRVLTDKEPALHKAYTVIDHIQNNITESLYKMRRLSSFIHNNYASPNIKDIEQARRRREIEEIDEIVQRNKFDSGNKGRDVGEIIEQHQSGVDKNDFRRSHTYDSPRKAASTRTLYNLGNMGANLKLNMKLISHQIDECSQDDQEADEQEINTVTFKKKQELQNSGDESHSLTNKSLRDHSEDDPFGKLSEVDGACTPVGTADQKGTVNFFDDINQMKASAEPKSGMLYGNKKYKGSTKNGCLRRGGSAIKKKEFIIKKFINLDQSAGGSSINSLMSQDSLSSQEQNSDIAGGGDAFYQVLRMQSMRPKQSIAGKKLERDAQIRQGQSSKQQTAQVLEFSLQSSNDAKHNMSNVTNNRNKQAMNSKSMILSLKKIETDQPYKSVVFDQFQNNSLTNKQRTSQRKDQLSQQRKSIMIERSLLVFPSSLAVQTSQPLQAEKMARMKKKQRRKEIKQLKKFMTPAHIEQEEDLKFILNQEKALSKLKKISENLKGHKITENCYVGEVNSRTDNDGSKSELTNNITPSYDHSPWRGKTVKSMESKEMSTPQGGNINPGRQSALSAAKSENHIFEQIKFTGSRGQSNLLVYNKPEVVKNESRKSQQSIRNRADTLSISGFNNLKYDLNVQNVNFSQRSRIQSMENFVAELISQQSKSASMLRKSKSFFKLEKKLSSKHLDLSRGSSFITGSALNNAIEEAKQEILSKGGHSPQVLLDISQPNVFQNRQFEQLSERSDFEGMINSGIKSTGYNQRLTGNFPRDSPVVAAPVPPVIVSINSNQSASFTPPSDPGEQKMEVEDEGQKNFNSRIEPLEEEKQPSMPQITFTRLQMANTQRKNENIHIETNSRNFNSSNKQNHTSFGASTPGDSEFSFKKSHLSNRKLDNSNVKIPKMDSFSFRKGDSPSQLAKIDENNKEEPKLSFNLISCLDDSDIGIKENLNEMPQEKPKKKNNFGNLDQNRFKQINKPRKITKYEQEYKKMVSNQRISSPKDLKIGLRQSHSKESISKNDILSKKEKLNIRQSDTIRKTDAPIFQKLPTLIISDQDKEEAKVYKSKNNETLPLPNHQNRASLGAMVFGLQAKQFSESPLKSIRKKSEQFEPKDSTIDEDLNELQSIFSRHHTKLSVSPRKSSQKKMKKDQYRINDTSIQDNNSIFNGSQSHLNEDFDASIISRKRMTDVVFTPQKTLKKGELDEHSQMLGYQNYFSKQYPQNAAKAKIDILSTYSKSVQISQQVSVSNNSMINQNKNQSMSKNNVSQFSMKDQQKRRQNEKQPVYYDSNQGNRYSILTEMVQGQPTGSNQGNRYSILTEMAQGQPTGNRFTNLQIVNENPFDQSDNVQRQPSKKNTNTNSGGGKNSTFSSKTGAFVMQSSGESIQSPTFKLKFQDSDPINARHKQLKDKY